MKIMVTGASGLVGRSLMKMLTDSREHEVRGLAFSRARPPLERLDLTDEVEVARYFEREAPEVVVHLAAERRPDIVDKDLRRARAINVEATRILARQCAARGAFLLLVSTDYVFDGTNPPYFPDSPVNPLNEYGKMKLESELAAEAALGASVGVAASLGAAAEPGGAASPGAAAARARPVGAGRGEPSSASARPIDRAIMDAAHREPLGAARPSGAVLRISILYGPVESLKESAVTEVAIALKTATPRLTDDWANRYPLHVDDVSSALLAIVNAYGRDPASIAKFGAFPRFLLSGFPSYTKYDMVNIMAKSLGIDASHIQPDPNPPKGAPRPRDCRMDTSRLESLGWKQQKMLPAEIGPILKPFF